MFQLIARLSFLQDIVAMFANLIPPILIHNFGKYIALKKAFYLAALEGTQGDYVEFGVFVGSSFGFALRAARARGLPKAGTSRFYGFDSFEGFGDLPEKDQHPFFTNINFKTDFHRVKRRLERTAHGSQSVHLIKGFFNMTLSDKSPKEYGIAQAAVILIDCDTFTGALACFDFVTSTLQEGTLLVIDDFFSYKGNPEKGVYGAFQKWRQPLARYDFRELDNYGIGGKIFLTVLKDK